ncbi:MAG: hypothetical protein RJB62_1429 [Pseudomonadota bacterium]|jgi:hypothetical protein
MAIEDGAIDLDAVGDHFRFRRTDAFGKVQEILLSDNDVLQLAASAVNLQGMVLRRAKKAGPRDLVVMQVAQAGIGIDTNKGNVHLKMIDPGGVSVAFAVPLVVAKPFAEGLLRRIPELEEKMAAKLTEG